MFSQITNIYNKKTKGPTLMELFTATGKLIFFGQPEMTRHTSIQYSNSYQTRFNTGSSIFFTAAMIHTFRWARSRDNGGKNNLHEMHVTQ